MTQPGMVQNKLLRAVVALLVYLAIDAGRGHATMVAHTTRSNNNGRTVTKLKTIHVFTGRNETTDGGNVCDMLLAQAPG